MTQPARSRQVHDLEADIPEADIGVTLFERVREGIQLTSDGEDLRRESLTC